ncbi:MAG TPA: hypothetical protein VGG72_14215 [Bryobacteraceae bacterium]|jgi:hypothetical protein
MLRFCLKWLLIGAAVPIFFYPPLFFGEPGLSGRFLLVFVVWPTSIVMLGDMPGITALGAALLIGISAAINGLLYAAVGAAIHFSVAENRRTGVTLGVTGALLLLSGAIWLLGLRARNHGQVIVWLCGGITLTAGGVGLLLTARRRTLSR